MKKNISSFVFSFICLFSLSMGIAFFCMQSPDQKIVDYTQTAQIFLNKSEDETLQQSAVFYLVDQAEDYIQKAQALNPYKTDHNVLIKQIEQRKSDLTRDTNTAFLPHKKLIP